MRRRLAPAIVLAALSTLVACAAPPAPLPPDAGTPAPWPPSQLLMYGEQHDQPDHQRQVADIVRQLAARGELAAVVIEMADAGRSTRGLPQGSNQAAVRDALAWAGWNWDDYAGVVMSAVQAGVPVLGGNLPRADMREAMRDGRLDELIDSTAREHLLEAVRSGHCDLLPASQLPGMVRIQIARDASMASTVAAALNAAPPDQRVLLLAGAQHVSRDRGVPLHLPPGTPLHVTLFGSAPPGLLADERRAAARSERPDPCVALRQRGMPGAAGRAAP
jgi:D-serine deaminase-like pyridoxal phosphate-dependent protein